MKVREALCKAMVLEKSEEQTSTDKSRLRRHFLFRRAILEEELGGPVSWIESGFTYRENGTTTRVVLVGGLSPRVRHRKASLEWSFLPGPLANRPSGKAGPKEPIYILGSDGTVGRFDYPLDEDQIWAPITAPSDPDLLRSILSQGSRGHKERLDLKVAHVEIRVMGPPASSFWIKPNGAHRKFPGRHGRGLRCSYAFEKEQTKGTWRVIFKADDPGEANRFFPIEVGEYGRDHRPAFWVGNGGEFIYLPPVVGGAERPLRIFDFWDKGQYWPEMVVPKGLSFWVNGSCLHYFDPPLGAIRQLGVCSGNGVSCASAPMRVIQPVLKGRQSHLMKPPVWQVGPEERDMSLLLLNPSDVTLVRWRAVPFEDDLNAPNGYRTTKYEEAPRIHSPWAEGKRPQPEELEGALAVREKELVHLGWVTQPAAGAEEIRLRSFDLTTGSSSDCSIPLPGPGPYQLLGYNRPALVLLRGGSSPSLVFLHEVKGIVRITPLPEAAGAVTAGDCRVVWGEDEDYPLDNIFYWDAYNN